MGSSTVGGPVREELDRVRHTHTWLGVGLEGFPYMERHTRLLDLRFSFSFQCLYSVSYGLRLAWPQQVQ